MAGLREGLANSPALGKNSGTGPQYFAGRLLRMASMVASGRMNEAIEKHCRELDRCNQRGGRMLSIFDLLADGTVDLDLATFLMAWISGGASFMVGAVPGGAGKTTVMCALLNFVPADVDLVAATPEAVRRAARARQPRRVCFVCHEIGSGPYYAYLWDEALRQYCGLFERGHVLATNLHADDMGESRNQVCERNGVPIRHFNRFDLLIFLRVEGDLGRVARRVGLVCVSDGHSAHVPVYDTDRDPRLRLDAAPRANGTCLRACRGFLAETFASGIRTTEQTRRAVLAFLAAQR